MKDVPSGAIAAQTVPRSARSAVYPSLAGKRVLVTGGGSGIGAGLVEAFARQGAETIFVDILDQESAAVVERLKDAPIKPVFQHPGSHQPHPRWRLSSVSLGGIDVLVNNAGNDDRHALQDITPAYWDERMAVNLRHMLFASKAAVPGMKARGGGAIINFGSISWHLGLPGLLLYETAKAGIEGLTRGAGARAGLRQYPGHRGGPGQCEKPRAR